MLRHPWRKNHRLRHYSWYGKSQKPSCGIFFSQSAECSRLCFRWTRWFFRYSLVNCKYFKCTCYGIQQIIHKARHNRPWTRHQWSWGVCQKIRCKSNRTKRRNLLCRFNVCLPYMQMPFKRHWYNNDRFNNASRWIRNWRCMYEPSDCCGTQGCTQQGNASLDRRWNQSSS